MEIIKKDHCQGIVQVTLSLTTIPSREAKASHEQELINKALEFVPGRRGQTFVSAEPDVISVVVIPSTDESIGHEKFILP
ncbi:MAG TPA: hypothetical protein PKJ63_01435 [Cyclobacteriaceae bacterium]|nr:hypothetical protein [Cyclobacteriaceae bacterium]